ncbi:hypothetical protein Tco_0887662 [Tanacetum coccineum]
MKINTPYPEDSIRHVILREDTQWEIGCFITCDLLTLSTKIFATFQRYGYIKNHMKTVKSKQARTREWKSGQKPEAKPGKVKPSLKATSAMGKAQIHIGFCAKTLTKEAQCHPKGNDTLTIFRCPHNDQMATIEAPMIKRNEWLRLKDWRARQEAKRIQGRL